MYFVLLRFISASPSHSKVSIIFFIDVFII